MFSVSDASAQQAFSTGPAIEDFGPVADIPGAQALSADTRLRVVFDTAMPAENGELNRTLVSAARFLNMHARAGLDPENIELAIVVHGRAVRDVADVDGGQSGINEALIAALTGHGVEIFVCGQSAAHYGVEAENLLPGVTLSLSAMTAHALLQQDGYTLNPF
ncbi:MAG: hypothetical protein GC188_11530 [Alphaproteobacteria bacterium]|nr:hypothetical protein [Alphaproteobacteria bacterium]